MHWEGEALKWRTSYDVYYKDSLALYGTKGVWKFKKVPLIKTFLGILSPSQTASLPIKKVNYFLRPFNLYVGLGSDAKKRGYFTVPSFIKHSPFHLIFMDLTGGKLPKMTKDNVFFQLMDFDVA